MVANDKLKEYAIKIFNGDSDYSLQKAYRLFRKYFTKIAFYYTELVTQKQEELTRRMIQQLGVIKAVEMRKIAAAAHREVKKYRTQILQELEATDIYRQSFDNEYDIYLYGEALKKRNIKTLKDLRNLVILNREALKAVEKTAQKYRYNEIFTEAAKYLIKNEDIYWQIAYAFKDSREKIESYYQYFLYKTEI